MVSPPGVLQPQVEGSVPYRCIPDAQRSQKIRIGHPGGVPWRETGALGVGTDGLKTILGEVRFQHRLHMYEIYSRSGEYVGCNRCSLVKCWHLMNILV